MTISYGVTPICGSAVVALWDVLTGTLLNPPMTVPEESEDVGAFATVDGRLVLVRGIDAGEGREYHPEDGGNIEVVDVATGTVLHEYEQRTRWSDLAVIARGADGAALVVGAERAVVVDPLKDGVPQSRYAAHHADVLCLAATEVGGRTVVASGDSGNGLHFWDLDTRRRLG